VEFGERVRRKSNATHTVAPLFAPPVSDKFRQLWYCVVITGLHDSPQFATATKYLDHALDLYPRDPEIQLLAGINHELRSSPRTKALVPKNIPDGSLRDAEAHFRAALAAQPDRQEARLRLGRLLLHRGNLAEARTMLTPLVSTEDPRLAYLAALFLGGVEDASRNPDAALTLYDRAVSGLGAHAQSARLAASELRHRKGDRLAAADAVLPATGDNTEFDPWWGYIFGEYWLLDSRLDSLRGLRRG
jgi:tetratricopeptide (TPR) repeat protein